MIKALLVDLDATLLDNDIDTFLKGYLKQLGGYLASRVPPDQLIPQLLRSTTIMLANRDPRRTLRQTFAQDFFPALGMSEAELLPLFESFYREEFPRLRGLTGQREAAAPLVASALNAGLLVVVATNPLFPRLAIDQRLDWAGVPSGRTPYALVTSYETFHSAKPQLAYYAEILGRLGVLPSEAAMVGDNVQDDLLPARALGMAAFHVSRQPDPAFPGGSLEDVIAWFPGAHEETDPEAARKPAGVLARLHGQLGALLAMLDGLTAEAWTRPPAPGEWSLAEIVCHLRDIDQEVHTPRLNLILASESPFLPPIDTGGWARERDYAHQSGPEALAALTEHRVETLSRLESLDPGAWQRKARHALFGQTTLAEVASIAADHERVHLLDIRRQAGPAAAPGTQTASELDAALHASSPTL